MDRIESGIEQRVRELEGRVSRLAFQARAAWTVTLLIIVGALVGFSARPGETGGEGSEAQTPFRVRDRHGKLVVEITSEEGTNRLRLYNATGENALALRADPAGGALGVLRGGEPVLLAAATEHGGALVLHGVGEEAGQMHLTILEDGGPDISLFNSQAEELASFSASRRGGVLRLLNGRGQGRVRLEGAEGGGALSLFPDDGKARVYLLADAKGGHGYLYGETPEGGRVHLTAVEEGGHMMVRGPRSGKVSGVSDLPPAAALLLRGEVVELRDAENEVVPSALRAP